MRKIYLIPIVAAGITLLLVAAFSSSPRVTPPAVTNTVAEPKPKLKPKTFVHRERKRIDAAQAGSTSESIDEAPEKISDEQLTAFLNKYNRNAQSLLTAFEHSRDLALLKEAAEKFPDDPRVQMAVLTQDTLDHALTPEERKSWLDRLKESSPNNGLADALGALDDFSNRRTEAALAEVRDSNAKTTMNSFTSEKIQGLEELFLNAGLSPLEARERAMGEVLLPLESKMKEVGNYLADLQKAYIENGDHASAAQVAALAMTFGARWANGDARSPLITTLVGMAMQNRVLQNLDPNTYYDFLGKTAAEAIADLNQQRDQVKIISREVAQYYPTLNDRDKMMFLERRKMYGERNAWSWLRQFGTATQ